MGDETGGQTRLESDEELDREVGANFVDPVSKGNILAYQRAIYRILRKTKFRDQTAQGRCRVDEADKV